MRNRMFQINLLILVLVAEMVALLVLVLRDTNDLQDAVVINEAVQSVQNDWYVMEKHKNETSLDYVVVDKDGLVVFKTKEGLSESINEAVIHKDTILDIEADGIVTGKIIIYNNIQQTLQNEKKTVVFILVVAMLLQCGICIGHSIYLNCTIIKPFRKLKGFAERIADGNLEVPLEMDRKNLFGAFTESFDMMRAELKKAQIAEARANASKKELVAKLSHDIKTPVASIMAASEVGAALTDNKKIKENYTQIIRKADQINTLITDLFTSTLEELGQISVMPTELESPELKTLLENSDYLHRTTIPNIPDCLIYADKLRLQQVFDNIFANSYKYADTRVEVSVSLDDNYLAVHIEDYGGGVSEEELPHLKEKFKRGSNTENIEGAGLGLYISDYFMKEMHGQLVIQNGENGLKVTIMISLVGAI